MPLPVLLAETPPWLLLLAGLALMMTILVRRILKWRRGRRRGMRPADQIREIRQEVERSQPRRDTPLLEAPADLARWHAEVLQIQRETLASLDTKIRLLQAVIRAADQRADRLERLLAQTDAMPEATASELAETLQALRSTASMAKGLPSNEGGGEGAAIPQTIGSRGAE